MTELVLLEKTKRRIESITLTSMSPRTLNFFPLAWRHMADGESILYVFFVKWLIIKLPMYRLVCKNPSLNPFFKRAWGILSISLQKAIADSILNEFGADLTEAAGHELFDDRGPPIDLLGDMHR